MTLNKRVPRFLKDQKSFYIGIFLLILLSAAIFLSFKTAGTSAKQSVEKNRIDCKVEDANFTCIKELDDIKINELEKKYDVNIQKSLYSDINYDDNGKSATVRVAPPYKEINIYSVYEGNDIKADGDILLDRFFLNAHKLGIGDSIKIEGREFKISGSFSRPDYLYIVKSETDVAANAVKFGTAIVGDKDYRAISKGNGKSYYSLRLNNSGGDAEKLKNELSDGGLLLNWIDKESNQRITRYDGEIEAVISMGNMAPFFIMLIGCFIMAIVMGRMLKREYAYIGTLSAMGFHKKEILIHYLILPLALSIIGSIIGSVCGYFLVEPFEISKMEFSVPVISFEFDWVNILIAMILPFVMILVTASLSVLKALRINTVTLLKTNSGQQKKSLLVRLVPTRIGKLKLGFKVRFKLKELFSNVTRSVLMLVGICVASMFILSGFYIQTSTDFLLKNSLDTIYNYEYQYVFNTLQTEVPQSGEKFMISSFDYNKDSAEKYSVTLNGIMENSNFIKLKDENGNIINKAIEGKNNADGINEPVSVVVSRSVAKRFEADKGDVITLTNRLSKKEFKIKVEGIADIRMGENVYLNINTLDKMLSIPEGTYRGLYSDKQLDIGADKLMNAYTRDDVKSGLESSVAVFQGALFILAFIAAIIGVIVIYIVTLMLIEENRRNISMLKVIGYHNKEISYLLLNSTSVMVWIGFLLAIPFSKVIMQGFFNELTANMYMAFNLKLELWQVLVTMVLIIAVYYVTLFFSRGKVLKVNMAESLKARE